MKTNKLFIIASITTCILSVILYAYMQSWIILQLPFTTTPRYTQLLTNAAQKKSVNLYWFIHKNWQTEQYSFLKTSPNQGLQFVINAWLTCLEDEKILPHEVRVESVCLSIEHELLLSLNNHLFHQQMSSFDKMMLLQGLAKTLHAYEKDIKSIKFFLHDRNMTDPHIDFSCPWIIQQSS